MGFGGLFGGGGSSTAAAEAATAEALAKQKEIFDLNSQHLSPYLGAGAGATNALSSGLGIGGDPNSAGYGQLSQGFNIDQFGVDPSYQFRLNEGQKGVERAMAAQGKTLTPEALKAMSDYSQGSASQEYGNAYDRHRTDQNDLFSRLFATAGLGQNAVGQSIGLGTNYANQYSDLKTNLGQAKDAASNSSSSGLGGALGGLAGGLVGGFGGFGESGGKSSSGGGFDVGNAVQLASLGASLFSDERLKENIELVGNSDGINLYEYNYKGQKPRYRGVVAQEVMKSHPDAVTTVDGFYKVNYGKLPVNMGVVCQ